MASAELWARGIVISIFAKTSYFPFLLLLLYVHRDHRGAVSHLVLHTVLSGAAGSPGRLPWLSHSSWAVSYLSAVPCAFILAGVQCTLGVTTAFRGRYHLGGPHLDYHMPTWLVFTARALERDTLWDIGHWRAKSRRDFGPVLRPALMHTCVHNL